MYFNSSVWQNQLKHNYDGESATDNSTSKIPNCKKLCFTTSSTVFLHVAPLIPTRWVRSQPRGCPSNDLPWTLCSDQYACPRHVQTRPDRYRNEPGTDNSSPVYGSSCDVCAVCFLTRSRRGSRHTETLSSRPPYCGPLGDRSPPDPPGPTVAMSSQNCKQPRVHCRTGFDSDGNVSVSFKIIKMIAI